MRIFEGWDRVAEMLNAQAAKAEDLGDEKALLDEGQRASIRVIAGRLREGRRALLVADEVGMGKTRIAAALIDAVRQCGGRTAIVMPAGLGAQWQAELRLFDSSDRTLLPLRSYESFIRGFGSDGDDDLAAGWQKRRDERLRDRRQQRELPNGNWRDEKILMISHAFARMSFPEPANGDLPWRRELMPALEALSKGRRRNMRDGGRGERRSTHRAAHAALETFDIQSLQIGPARDWRRVSSEEYRRAVLPVIGRALGRFDLVVIDEAHKARGEESSLSRILGPLIWECEDPFRLGLTATPVELDADQWRNTLKRLVAPQGAATDDGADDNALSALEKPISDYATTAKRLQTEPLCEALVAKFEQDAKAFSDALGPYVIRRDKRSDKELVAFREKHGVDYRDIRTVSVAPAEMGRDWLRAFCAAETLSILPQTDRSMKRRRLTIETGHGLDKLILEPGATEAVSDLDFWSRNALLPEGANIFEHPAIRAAVKTIEAATAEGRKVLVFGTLVSPLQALTRLLDARAMLRHLAEGRHWPARRVHAGTEDALRAALRAPDCPSGAPASIDEVSRLLEERYGAVHRKRRAGLRAMHREIIARARDGHESAMLILQIWPEGDPGELFGESRTALFLEALEGRLARRPQARGTGEPIDWTAAQLLQEAQALISELTEGAGDGFAEERSDGTLSRDASLLQLLSSHLVDYSGHEGNFARLLYGQTPPQTRRLLQAAFNREGSWPMVLVAQSTVGREGLNLHEECRTVVLLHAEWNPGVVEQQIGRVDRKNSRFLKDYHAGVWRKNGLSPPRIEIHCIQMDGGYDSHHWAVLRERWASLRAQLHGDVVATKDRAQDRTNAELADLIKRLERATPDFYPSPTTAFDLSPDPPPDLGRIGRYLG
ncbi:helicase-related protein [Xanthobacter autotrophicus]|uniref:helicase-related protein n=1 Tax=Xanthobacter autotrophicus TaxID=280 RepID=UPI003726EA8A